MDYKTMKQGSAQANYELADSLSRTRLLLGDEATLRLMHTRVIVFGVGGVGSWCVEALVRSGVRRITIVDPDCVCPSNINRQLMATAESVGQVKVFELKKRLLSICPEADIDARHEAFTAETAANFALDSYDFIVDAIDSIPDKMRLIIEACKTNAMLLSSMGAARKLNVERIRTAEFWKVQGCPLARKLRQEFKKANIRPAKKFTCVFSDELLSNQGTSTERRANGSMVHITAVFGMTLAGKIIENIYQIEN